MKKIEINGKEFIIKNTISSLIDFEEMTGKEVDKMKNLKDRVTFIYCRLKAANKATFKYTFDEFLEILDNEPQILAEFNEPEPEKKSVKKD